MIVIAVIGLLAAVAIPNLMKARIESQRNACINNMRRLSGAASAWALENKKGLAEVPTQADLVEKLYLREMPVCPAGGTYTLAMAGAKPTCTINGHTL